tara:strand:+ start:2538 stop:2762 length:225 start_codon:yes stop_codon:yes gene_type:complete
MSVLLKYHGDNIECLTLAEFKAALAGKYIGREITIEYKLESGIKTTVIVKVNDDCSLSSSYNGEDIKHSQFGLT